MHENTTRTYKKRKESNIKTINKSGKQIEKRLELEDKIK